MQTVSFKKYADIIVNLQMKNASYHLIKRFDDDMLDYIRSRFDKESGLDFMERFDRISDAIVQLKKQGCRPAAREAGRRKGILGPYYGIYRRGYGHASEAGGNRKNRRASKQLGGKAEAGERVYRACPAALFCRVGGGPVSGGGGMSAAIQVCGLKKSYGGRAVLKGLDFHIRQGEIFALLGVNGAGKTTALECMEGLRSCDGGTVTVYGK